MRAVLLALAGLLVASAAPRPAYTGPSYTRATLANRSTAELAATFLSGVDPATIEDYEIQNSPWPGGPLTNILFDARPRLLAPDICGRDAYSVDFALIAPFNQSLLTRDEPSRFNGVYHRILIGLAANCRLPRRERTFAEVNRRRIRIDQPELSLEAAMAILRAVVEARAAAAAPAPLPFRITCGPLARADNPACRTDPRGFLAHLPVERAVSIDRGPFNTDTCGSVDPDTGDSVGISGDDQRRGFVWEVRLHAMGTDQAEISFEWGVPWNGIRC